MKKLKWWSIILSLFLFFFVLYSCGGGGGGTYVPPTNLTKSVVPIDGYLQFTDDALKNKECVWADIGTDNISASKQLGEADKFKLVFNVDPAKIKGVYIDLAKCAGGVIDNATGNPPLYNGELKAPADSEVITPLTTLLVDGKISKDDPVADVVKKFDPVEAVKNITEDNLTKNLVTLHVLVTTLGDNITTYLPDNLTLDNISASDNLTQILNNPDQAVVNHVEYVTKVINLVEQLKQDENVTKYIEENPEDLFVAIQDPSKFDDFIEEVKNVAPEVVDNNTDEINDVENTVKEVVKIRLKGEVSVGDVKAYIDQTTGQILPDPVLIVIDNDTQVDDYLNVKVPYDPDTIVNAGVWSIDDLTFKVVDKDIDGDITFELGNQINTSAIGGPRIVADNETKTLEIIIPKGTVVKVSQHNLDMLNDLVPNGGSVEATLDQDLVLKDFEFSLKTFLQALVVENNEQKIWDKLQAYFDLLKQQLQTDKYIVTGRNFELTGTITTDAPLIVKEVTGNVLVKWNNGVCSADNLKACYTQEDCEKVGGFWYAFNNTCVAEKPCGEDNLAACETAEECDWAGGNWLDNMCTACSPDNLDACNTQELCDAVQGNWLNVNGKNVCAFCFEDFVQECETQDLCEAVGGAWINDECVKVPEDCTIDNVTACNTEDLCAWIHNGDTGYWYTDEGADAPTCHDTKLECSLAHPELCKTQTDCENIDGLYWWGDGCHNLPMATISNISSGQGFFTATVELPANVTCKNDNCTYIFDLNNDGFVDMFKLVDWDNNGKLDFYEVGIQSSDFYASYGTLDESVSYIVTVYVLDEDGTCKAVGVADVNIQPSSSPPSPPADYVEKGAIVGYNPDSNVKVVDYCNFK